MPPLAADYCNAERHEYVQGSQDADVKALVALFAPNGKLLQAVQAADADNLIKFDFPINRLPTHTQQMMCVETGR